MDFMTVRKWDNKNNQPMKNTINLCKNDLSIPVSFLCDRSLSLAAKGLLLSMAATGNGEYNPCEVSDNDTKATVESAYKELKDRGFVKRVTLDEDDVLQWDMRNHEYVPAVSQFPEEKVKRKSKARPKDAGEVIEYCKSIGLKASDGEYMFNKWEGSEYKNGSTTVKDWKAVIRSWKNAKYFPSQRVSGPVNPGF